MSSPCPPLNHKDLEHHIPSTLPTKAQPTKAQPTKAQPTQSLPSESETCSGVSVIIPTYRRLQMCETLLASLHPSQQICNVPYEIWVIDDSPEPDAQMIQAVCHRYQVHYVWHHGPVSQKRNVGAHQSQYSILLFVDSDCIATPELVQGHWDKFHNEPNAVAVVGKTEFKGPKPWLWQVIEYTPYLDAFAIANTSTCVVWGPSNNLSCRRNTFETLGGFDDSGPQPIGGEDAEFGYRLYYSGYMMHTCPHALIYHTTETWTTLPQVLVRLLRWSRGDIYLKLRYWNELYYDCPSRFGTMLLLLPIGASAGFLVDAPFWLLLPLVFLVVSIGSSMVQQVMGCSKRVFSPFKVFASESLILFYDTCSLIHCLQYRFLMPLFSCMLLRPEDALIMWNNRTLHSGIRLIEVMLSGWFVWALIHLKT